MGQGPVSDLRTAVESMAGGVALWGADQRHRYSTPTYAELLGVGHEDLRAASYRDALGAGAYRRAQTCITRALGGATCVIDEDRVDVQRGPIRLRSRYSPALARGTIVGFVVLVVDITPQARAESTAVDRAVAAAEDERHRALAEEVHASVLQDLFAALMQHEQVVAAIRRSNAYAMPDDALTSRVGQLGDLLLHSIRQLRDIATPNSHPRTRQDLT